MGKPFITKAAGLLAASVWHMVQLSVGAPLLMANAKRLSAVAISRALFKVILIGPLIGGY